MKKLLFACDLDNTLIHSHKYKTDSDICVEYYQGRPQSFLSQKAVVLFQELIHRPDICFLPVTTRTVVQYERIFFPEQFQPEFALVANGHLLLKDAVIDEKWLADSQEIARPWLAELARMEALCQKDSRFRHVQVADGMFVAAACETPESACICLQDYQNSTELAVFRTGRKLYFFQPHADKGSALQKFISEYDFDVVIAAGDSAIDLPMLAQADIGITKLQDIRFIIHEADDFTEFILNYILNFNF